MSEGLVIFLVGQAILILFGGVSIYTKISLKLKELDLRVSIIERQDNKITNKLDQIYEKVNKIEIELQNKQDR